MDFNRSFLDLLSFNGFSKKYYTFFCLILRTQLVTSEFLFHGYNSFFNLVLLFRPIDFQRDYESEGTLFFYSPGDFFFK